jgi:D-alanyl-D-alanine carboxypeptidase
MRRDFPWTRLRIGCALILATLLQSGWAAPPACEYADEPAPLLVAGEPATSLVDTYYRLPADYAPADLVSVRSAGLEDDRTLRAAVVTDLAEMLAAAERQGVRFELQSAYRSHAYQERVFAGWVDALGLAAALSTSARPGHSEHQLGTALDLRSAGGAAPWDLADWAETPEGAWLERNGWRFGFLMSYPRDKEQVTCYAYEPWHYRWLGRDRAALIHESGLTVREWLWLRLQGRDN